MPQRFDTDLPRELLTSANKIITRRQIAESPYLIPESIPTVNIIEQAKREAEAFANEARAKLSETLDRRSRQAEQKIAQAEAQAVKEVRNIATDLAVAAAGHLIGDTAKGPTGTKLIDDAISQLKSKLN